MTERFLPRVGHIAAKPFVETGKAVRRVCGDICEGGWLKRIEANHGYPVKRSRLQDVIRATSPVALLGGTAGFAIPLGVETVQEVTAEINSLSSPMDVNWLPVIIGTSTGVILGTIANAEHSRRKGRESRELREYLEAVRAERRRSFENKSQPSTQETSS